MCHIEHMIQITIRELHMKTGAWVRKAAHAGNIVVMDRNHPVAKLVPFTQQDQGRAFADRIFINGFSKLPKIPNDSGRFISQDRDRA